MADKLKVGLIGGTGLVGQRLVSLLDRHPGLRLWLLRPVSNLPAKVMLSSSGKMEASD
jgi:aspartate-semialdehyde dehydrogenase